MGLLESFLLILPGFCLLSLQLLTLFDGLGSVLGSKEVAEKAITAYTEKRENVGKWFEEAMVEGNALIEIFQKSSFDQGEPANQVKRELEKLREEKDRVDQLWLDAQKKSKVDKTRKKSEEKKSSKKQVVAASVHILAARPEAEGKEASPPSTLVLEPSPEQVSRVAHTRSTSVDEKGKVKVVRTQSSDHETVSRWLTDEYAELEEEAYKVCQPTCGNVVL